MYQADILKQRNGHGVIECMACTCPCVHVCILGRKKDDMNVGMSVILTWVATVLSCGSCISSYFKGNDG